MGLVTSVPSTVMRPFCTGSRPLTVLISVDLPDPDGPHTTATSPLSIFTEQSRSTCTGPYHLETFSILIMGSLIAYSSSNDGYFRVQAPDQP